MTLYKRQILTAVLTTLLYGLVTLTFTSSAHAAWFESSGQAAIRNGNIELARQNATQEAIKQVLLFAGASVQSVQKMANGVLQNDDLIIRASGEVNSIELIDEVVHNGYITVSLRADIFSQTNTCQSSSYPKSLVTTWHPINNRMQAATGNIYDLGTVLPLQLQLNFNTFSQQAMLQTILPFYFSQNPLSTVTDAIALAKKANSQYVLVANVTDISVSSAGNSKWKFLHDKSPMRHFGYHVSLYDGYTGSSMWQKSYTAQAPWEFDVNSNVDINSSALWQSQYGMAISTIMQDIAVNVDETLACAPAYGRIIQIRGGQLTLNIGSNHGLKNGDELTLFQMQQLYDSQGQTYTQFNLHPTPVNVTSVSQNTSVVMSKDGSLLGSIQVNDFVSR